MNEVSRDLVVNTDSKKKQALMHLLPVLAELLHAWDMEVSLESLVEESNFCEVWLGRTLQKLDSLLLGACQEFKEEGYLTVLFYEVGDLKRYSINYDKSGRSKVSTVVQV
ncbi:uncharacterized protein LOC128291889 [Gossypium arboreum]|uniref:uncharacterized protein LOC128291889 n=1 Tax=Gossypium arboreum TaxID=29729 RepID=UPI0022F1DBC3|nr:uncharacterized protein LOC128291889 [Gossypium arboreum]